jgi:hypothetical protein
MTQEKEPDTENHSTASILASRGLSLLIGGLTIAALPFLLAVALPMIPFALMLILGILLPPLAPLFVDLAGIIFGASVGLGTVGLIAMVDIFTTGSIAGMFAAGGTSAFAAGCVVTGLAATGIGAAIEIIAGLTYLTPLLYDYCKSDNKNASEETTPSTQIAQDQQPTVGHQPTPSSNEPEAPVTTESIENSPLLPDDKDTSFYLNILYGETAVEPNIDTTTEKQASPNPDVSVASYKQPNTERVNTTQEL